MLNAFFFGASSKFISKMKIILKRNLILKQNIPAEMSPYSVAVYYG